MSASAHHIKNHRLMMLPAVVFIMFAVLLCADGQIDPVAATRVKDMIATLKVTAPTDEVITKADELGRLLLSEKRFAEAVQLFAAVLGREPHDALALYGAALASFNMGKPAEAEPLARAAVEAVKPTGSGGWSTTSPEQRSRAADALVLLAIVVAVRGDDAQSLKIAESAVAIAPDHYDAQFCLGRALYGVGDPNRAAKAFRVAVSLNPTDPRARFFLGTALEAAGDIDGAIVAYRQLVASQPSTAEGHLGLGTLLVKRGGDQSDEGLKELGRALEIQPDLYEAQVALGRALIATGHPAESVAHLIRAADLAPGNPEPHYQLSLAYRRLGRSDKAAQETAIVKRIHETRRTPGDTQTAPEN